MPNSSLPHYLRHSLVAMMTLLVMLPGSAHSETPTPPSVIEVPLRMSLKPLFDMAEQEMPLQTGNPYRWQDAYGVQTRYQAWRGPLMIQVQGNELIAQAHVRYWLQVRKRLVGGMTLKSDCGLGEAPRQALIGVRMRLDWTRDWTLWPRFQVLPAHFLNECEMTLADIDVTPLIGREFQEQLATRMRVAVMGLLPRLGVMQSKVEKHWYDLQQPIDLGAGHWLLLRPNGIALSPLEGFDDLVETRLALLLAPQVLSGEKPEIQAIPLPGLTQFYPRADGVRLQLALGISFADIGHAISREVAGQTFRIQGHQGRIEGLSLSGQGQQLAVDIQLGGALAGEVKVTADLDFNPETKVFEVHNLAFDPTLDDTWLEGDIRLFYNIIRRNLAAGINAQLKQRMQLWRERLSEVLSQIAPVGTQSDMTGMQLRDVELNMAPDQVQLQGWLSGHVLLKGIFAEERIR